MVERGRDRFVLHVGRSYDLHVQVGQTRTKFSWGHQEKVPVFGANLASKVGMERLRSEGKRYSTETIEDEEYTEISSIKRPTTAQANAEVSSSFSAQQGLKPQKPNENTIRAAEVSIDSSTTDSQTVFEDILTLGEASQISLTFAGSANINLSEIKKQLLVSMNSDAMADKLTVIARSSGNGYISIVVEIRETNYTKKIVLPLQVESILKGVMNTMKSALKESEAVEKPASTQSITSGKKTSARAVVVKGKINKVKPQKSTNIRRAFSR